MSALSRCLEDHLEAIRIGTFLLVIMYLKKEFLSSFVKLIGIQLVKLFFLFVIDSQIILLRNA